jgi:branched-chain amino acid transport system ATP-binding protein
MHDMLQISDLHSHYGSSHIIQGISLSAQPGEVIGIFGRNGVGKTTLLKTIAGWVHASSGSIELGGMKLNGLSPDQICRAGTGFVPEDRRIFPGLTVQENLELGLMQVSGRSKVDEQAAIARIYERLALPYQVASNKCLPWRAYSLAHLNLFSLMSRAKVLHP